MKDVTPAILMRELLNKDRFSYIEIIMESEEGTRSNEIAEKILKSKGVTSEEEIQKENIMVNKRLRKLVDLGILKQVEEGKYSMSGLGYLLVDSWEELTEKLETTKKFGDFFNSHYIDAIPKEFFRQIYKLKEAELTQNPVQWIKEVTRHMGEVKRKFYNLTEYLHDVPEYIIEKKVSGKTGDIEIVIIYEFKKYPNLNYPDEEELFRNLAEAGVEFRYITLENRHPIGIRVVDEKWASFGLARISDGMLDRDHAFVGTDREFISWCRDLMYHIWSFEAKSLTVREVK